MSHLPENRSAGAAESLSYFLISAIVAQQKDVYWPTVATNDCDCLHSAWIQPRVIVVMCKSSGLSHERGATLPWQRWLPRQFALRATSRVARRISAGEPAAAELVCPREQNNRLSSRAVDLWLLSPYVIALAGGVRLK